MKEVIGNLTEKVRISVPYFRSKHESGLDDTEWTRTSLSPHLEGQTRITNPSFLSNFPFQLLDSSSYSFSPLGFIIYTLYPFSFKSYTLTLQLFVVTLQTLNLSKFHNGHSFYHIIRMYPQFYRIYTIGPSSFQSYIFSPLFYKFQLYIINNYILTH